MSCMSHKVAKRTISALQRIVTGNPIESLGKPLAPYRSGPTLVAFFNELGCNDTYSFQGGFPSRWSYAESSLDEMNGADRLAVAFEAAVDPATYLDTDFKAEEAVEYLNKYLAYDGFELVLSGKKYRLRPLGEPLVAVEVQLQPEQHASHEFISEQIEKCDRKLREEDYDGAITNARSVVEAVLSDVEARLDPAPPPYDGDLAKLYKRVQKVLNLDPERPDISDSLRQLLRGLVNIIGGLAPLRNKMGDAHVRTYKPARHHAKLAVNAAKTLLDFVYDSFEYQKGTGKIAEIGDGTGNAG
jgi:hypothetical protein